MDDAATLERKLSGEEATLALKLLSHSIGETASVTNSLIESQDRRIKELEAKLDKASSDEWAVQRLARMLKNPKYARVFAKFLVAAGFAAKTRGAVGFVRKYDYEHHDGRVVSCHTGASSDYWQSGDKRGYWGELESWCKSR